MSFVKPVLKATIGLQAVALAGNVLKVIPKIKSFDLKKQQIVAPKKIIKTGMDTFVGVGLLKPTADIVAGF
jgi:hypothetical protein